jgi:hypothetical protein
MYPLPKRKGGIESHRDVTDHPTFAANSVLDTHLKLRSNNYTIYSCRLAALEQRSSGAPPAKRSAPTPSTGAAASGPSRAAPSHQQTSSQALPESNTNAVNSGGDRVYAPLLESVATGPVAQALSLAAEGSLATMLEELMATNPRASDSKTIAGGKLRDKTLLLDNPAVQRDQKRRSGGGQVLTAALATRKEQKRQGLYNMKNAANLT